MSTLVAKGVNVNDLPPNSVSGPVFVSNGSAPATPYIPPTPSNPAPAPSSPAPSTPAPASNNGGSSGGGGSPAPTTGANAAGQAGTWQTNPTTGIEEFVPQGSQPSWLRPNVTGGTDTVFAQAESNVAPGTPPSEEDFFTKIKNQMQPVLDAIQGAETAAETAAAEKARQSTSALNFGANARGLAGSSEAASEAADITMQQGADVAAAKQAQATALSTAYQFLTSMGDSEFQAALSRNDTNSKAYIAQQQAMAQSVVSNLFATGLSPDTLMAQNPTEYSTLLQYFNGDVNAMNAAYVQAASKSLMNNGQPVFSTADSSVYGQMIINPDGTPGVKYTTVKHPANIPPNYKMQGYNQAANGQVLYYAAPVDANGNILLDPSLPNNGLITGTIGGMPMSGNQSTTPDPTSTAITAQTGLSINAFNFLTQGTSALSRMSQSARAQVQQEAQDWANKNGVDLSTFQSQFKANNETLASNISRFNNTNIAEGEVTGTLANLNTAAIDAGLGDVNLGNVGQILAGQNVNDPKAAAYAFYFNDLKNSLAYFYAAQQGKSSPDVIDNQDAANVIVSGLSTGGVAGLQTAIEQTTAKMKTVLQTAVDSAQQNVWNLFKVGQNYQPQDNQPNNVPKPSSQSNILPAGTIIQDGAGNKYTVGADGESLTPYTGN